MASLEDKIDALKDSVDRLAAITTDLMNLRQQAINEVQGAAKPAKAEKATKEDKPAKAEKATKEDKGEAKPNISETPEDRKNPADEAAETGPTHDDLRAAIKAFTGLDDDEQGRENRLKIVQKIIAHEKVTGKPDGKVSDVPESAIPLALANIKKQHEKAEAEMKKSAAGSDDDLLG